MTTYMPERERLPFAKNALYDPHYVGLRAAHDRVPVWVPDTMEALAEYHILEYRFVDPKDVEVMPAGTHAPEKKDFGLRYEPIVRNGRVYGAGNMILMWVHRKLRDQRLQDELNSAKNRKGTIRDVRDRGVHGESEVGQTVEELGASL